MTRAGVLLVLLLSTLTLALAGEKSEVSIEQIVEQIEKIKEEAAQRRVLLEALREVPLRKTPVTALVKGDKVGIIEPGTTWEALDTQEQFLVTGKGYWVRLRKTDELVNEAAEGWAYLGATGLSANFKVTSQVH